ncbi:contractile injection system protein, VgrG/Pvc8 family [Sphingomonas sp. CFBP9019]|uniref:contractile injection system protein, VgrG/Pvc8 family n=1 Tax=Sphingomonas sp. CFBP9019 TaxID=3096532 RepID=UPI002A69B9BB|nr:contractile injection system protein, VgrG/Pvc8 family [Sphingomonas sp. CFBP9019]MDY1008766.1 contractile injection system protein, VgrG/Pvc8 family [Sphingomonas sp. CFBP9019]
MIANIAAVRVVVDGTDITPLLEGRVAQADGRPPRRRLVSLGITEKRGEEADQLDLVIDDTDGAVALPPTGAKIHVWLGWKQGSDVTPGLVDKGWFIVDEVAHGGPPDLITIRARSADFTSDLKTRRERSWHGTTLGAIVTEIAEWHQLTPRCAASLADIAVTAKAQNRESDLAFLRRLGRERGAVAKIARGVLIFSPLAAGTTPSGRPIATVTIARRDGDAHQFSRQKRDDVPGVKATWHDRRSGKREQCVAGKVEGAKTLSRVYANEADAQVAANSANGRAGREPASLSLTLSLGRPEVHVGMKSSVSGYKLPIDGVAWLVIEVTHTFSDRGYSTGLNLEAI